MDLHTESQNLPIFCITENILLCATYEIDKYKLSPIYIVEADLPLIKVSRYTVQCCVIVRMT